MKQSPMESPEGTTPLVDVTDEMAKREDGQREDRGAALKAKQRPTCGECGKSCANARMLGFHKAIHLNYDERPYGCETCGRRYAYPSHLARHRRQKHLNIQAHPQRLADNHTTSPKHEDIHTTPEKHVDMRTPPNDDEIHASAK